MCKKIIASLTFCLYTICALAQQPWKLSTQQEGIKVYTRPVASSNLKAIKVECELQAAPSQLVALLLNVNACTEWVYRTKSCRLVKRVSPAELYYYSEVSVPWPAQNRDFIAHLIVSQDADTKVVTIDAPCVNGLVPVKTDVVRIEHSTGRWVITPVGNNRVKINYELHADPGGDVPAWLTNMFASQGPLQSFKNLRAQLQKADYRNARLDFIKDE
ncbi:START domain-containing protein [Mucilaginibacter sp.]